MKKLNNNKGVLKKMKKRLLSLILALVLVIGVAVVPSVGAEAASSKNTTLTLKNKSVAITFTVAKAKRNAAATALNKTLGATVKTGKSFVIVINGKKYKAINKKGTIYVAGIKLTEFVKTRGALTSKTSITVKANFKNIFRVMSLSGKTASFNYTIKVGKATIKNVKITKGKKMTFTGNGKKYTATIKSGKIILSGSHSKDAFVKNMRAAKVIK